MKKNIFITYQFLILIFLGIFFRLIWFNTPLEIDEGIYAYQISLIKHSPDKLVNSLPALKSPLIYLIYLPPFIIKDHSFIAIRLYGLLLYLTGVILSVKVGYMFSKKENEAYLNGLIYILMMSTPIFQGFLNKVGIIYVILFYLSLLYLKEYIQSKKRVDLYLFVASYILVTIGDPRTFYLSFFHLSVLNKRRLLSRGTIKKIGLYSLIFLAGSWTLVRILFKKDIFLILWDIILRKIDWYIEIPFQHNIHIPYIPIYLAQISFFAFIVMFSYFKYKKFENEFKIVLQYCFIYLILILILPTYGHYVLNITPLFGILASRTLIKFQKNRLLIAGIFLTIVLFIWSSVLLYPNLNIEDINLQFSGFSSIEEQREIVEYLKENLNENESFYLYSGWNDGLFWLVNKSNANRAPIRCTSLGVQVAKERYYQEEGMKFVLSEREEMYPGYDECITKLYGNVSLKFNKKIGLIYIYNLTSYN